MAAEQQMMDHIPTKNAYFHSYIMGKHMTDVLGHATMVAIIGAQPK